MNTKHTLAELIDRYIAIILPTKPKDARNAQRQLEWWKAKLGKYALQTISPDLIAQYRKELAEGTTSKGTRRSPATVNRYLAILSTVMTYAVRETGWISDNPCLRVTKFQESKGRDRVASPDECSRLLEACKNSRNEHLPLIVLLAITTGMRQGEILGLTWDCIDFVRETITLKETKNGRPRDRFTGRQTARNAPRAISQKEPAYPIRLSGQKALWEDFHPQSLG